jgi:gamma-glutamyltranspeptidase / glutathione hydrolase
MFTTRPELRGTFGMVASTHWLASAAGMAVLERGGNAFDAAAAAGFVLQVVEPHLNGPLGEAPMLLWDEKTGQAAAICGQGVAPQAATIAAYRDLGLDLVPGSGLLAACVPAAFDSWMTLLRDRGTWRLAEILDFAIGYASAGYPLVPRIATTIGTVQELFQTEWRSSAAVYLPNGAPPLPGRLFRNPGIAGLYRRLIEEAQAAGSDRVAQIEAARRAWSQGFVAEAIDRFCRTREVMDTSGRRHRGFLSGADLARWQASIEAPIAYEYQGWRVLKCGPWSQGPVLLESLALLDGIDLGQMDPLGADFVHHVAEALKLAFADRDAWLGDPDFVDVPLATLLSPAYATERRRLIGAEASRALRPGQPDGRMPVLPRLETSAALASAAAGEPTMARLEDLPTRRDGQTRGDTVHVDVIDRWGNMVSATPSGGWLQSSPVIPELGCCLGTRGQMFWLDERLPGALAPGKRPRTTLTPSMAIKGDTARLAFGTPGGDQQEQWSLLLFLRHVHHGWNLQQAIDAPAFHTEHLVGSFYPRLVKPGSLMVENRFPAETLAELTRRGHLVEAGEAWSEGRLSACSRVRDGESWLLKAGANPRGMQGYAVGR